MTEESTIITSLSLSICETDISDQKTSTAISWDVVSTENSGSNDVSIASLDEVVTEKELNTCSGIYIEYPSDLPYILTATTSYPYLQH